jgi:hypothetical protein
MYYYNVVYIGNINVAETNIIPLTIWDRDR